jgi:hypothetical protein
VEICDLGLNLLTDDGTLHDNNPVKICADLVSSAMETLGRLTASEAAFRELLENAGFVDIEVSFQFPSAADSV